VETTVDLEVGVRGLDLEWRRRDESIQSTVNDLPVEEMKLNSF
jgi:hypothetical protein